MLAARDGKTLRELVEAGLRLVVEREEQATRFHIRDASTGSAPSVVAQVAGMFPAPASGISISLRSRRPTQLRLYLMTPTGRASRAAADAVSTRPSSRLVPARRNGVPDSTSLTSGAN